MAQLAQYLDVTKLKEFGVGCGNLMIRIKGVGVHGRETEMKREEKQRKIHHVYKALCIATVPLK